MEKAVTHFIILVVLFFGTWFLLSKVDFMGIFNVEEMTRKTERKLGNIVLDVFKKGHNEIESDSVRAQINSIKQRICKANGVEDSSITIHIILNDDVNAFALPDRHLVIYSGLVMYCDSAEELSGVMAHEISHMQLNHVMKKLMKEVGLSMLTSVAGGESGEMARSIVKLLSSTAFDREQESEADASAVHMMAKAEIDPQYFANFMLRLSKEKNDIPKNFELISTHPNSQDRSEEILKMRKTEVFNPRPLMGNSAWADLKKTVKEEQDKEGE